MPITKDLVNTGMWKGTADAVTGNVATAITAAAGGGQANATTLTAVVNVVGTVATIADSVKVFANASPGDEIFVLNKTANSMNLFPQSGGTLNNAGANTAVAVAGGKSAACKAISASDWVVVVSA